MADDTGAGTGTGSATGQGDQQNQGGGTASTGPGAGPAKSQAPTGTGTGNAGDGTAGAAAGSDDPSAEELLADMVNTGDGEGQGAGADDPAAQLAALQKQHADLKKHARTWEQRAKQNSAAAAKLTEIENAGKTELQRATDRAVTAEQSASKWESLYHRTLAAAVHDIPPNLIDQITGATEEEINASAEALAAAINEAAAARAQTSTQGQHGQPAANGVGYRPVESLRPGALPAGDNGAANDPNAWIRRALNSRR